MKYRALAVLERGLLLFWSLWATLVALTDGIDFLQQIKMLPADWTFSSGNHALVVKSLAYYHWDFSWLTLSLYGAIVLLSAIIALLFWRAFFTSREPEEKYLCVVYWAFLFKLGIDLLFMIVDEVFMQYDLEHGHMNRLIFIFVTFITFTIIYRINKPKNI